MGEVDDIEDIYALSPLQEGMLFHELSQPGVYAPRLSIDIEGPFDLGVCRQIWDRLVARHGALRTSFVWDQGDKPVQIVWRAVELPWHESDLRALPADRQEAALADLLDRDRSEPFSLDRAPLLRITAVRLRDDLCRLVLVYHHIVLDGWSVAVLLRECMWLYASAHTGHTAALPPAPKYGDFIAWLQRPDRRDADAYWRGVLGGIDAPTPLGIDRHRARGSHGERTVRLSRELGMRMSALARRERVTASTIVQAAWALVLSRYSGEDDVVFGITVSGRPAALNDVESAVGLFINTLPVRVRLDPSMSSVAWLKTLQGQMLALQDHEHTPLVRVRASSDVPASEPLFESLVVYENYPVASAPAGDAHAPRVGAVNSEERTHYPLSFAVSMSDELAIRVSYQRARFDDVAIDRLLAHMESALAQLVDPSSRPLREIHLVTEAERRLLDQWSRGPTDPALHPSAVALFEAQAARTPDAIAVTFEGASLSYGELSCRARQLGRHLRSLGVREESLVALCAERSLEMAVGIFGVLSSGAAFLPVDPHYPAERIAYILEDARPRAVLTEEHLASRAVVPGAPVVRLGAPWPSTLLGDPPPGDPHAAAYVIYTSGSTGRPKGAVLEHAGLCNLALALVDSLGLTTGSRVLQFCAFGFDASVSEWFSTLLSGGTLVMPNDQSLHGAELVDLLERERIESVAMPASALEAIPRGRLAALRVLTVGGEPCSPEKVREWSTGRVLVNAYGPTEATVTATIHVCAPNDEGAPPIGRPLANVRAYVVDREGAQALIGVVGELVIGGAGVGRGYLGRPRLTAERFVPDPFDRRAGARAYRTGDRCRWDERGRLEYLARIDEQVKVRGFRIELGEIENVLLEHDAVARAVVSVRERSAGDKWLIAHVVTRGHVEIPEDALRSHLRARLPEYMVPSVLVGIDELPLTPSGKLDRRALVALGDVERRTKPVVAPRTATERAIAGIWKAVLERTQVGVTDDFFALGGHSLLATRVIAQIARELDVELPITRVFEARTLEQLARAVDEARGVHAPQLPAIEPIARDTSEREVSYGQERLWFIWKLEPESTAYNMMTAVRLCGRLDVEALEAALSEVVARHEVLRTRFVERGGGLVGMVDDEARLVVAREETTEQGLAERLRHDSERPFDLSCAPLLRATLYRLRPDEHVLSVGTHHAVGDGWSVAVLVTELSELYAARSEKRPSRLAALPVQYADYAAWQRKWLSGEQLEAMLEYWKGRLAGIPVLELPTDRPRPPAPSGRGAISTFDVPAELGGRVKELASRTGTTEFMVLLAAFEVLLGRYGRSSDFGVGTAVAGRRRPELEPLIGFFIQTVVLRADLSGDPTFEEVLGRVRETALEAYAHQDAPFEKVVDAVQPARQMSTTPLFQVMFVLQNMPRAALRLGDVELEAVDLAHRASQFDLSLHLIEGDRGEGLRAVIEYALDLFDRDTVERFAARYVTLVGRLLDAPERPIGDVDLLSGDDRRLLLVEWNATAASYPRELSTHALLEQQVARTPDVVAVVFEDEHATYAELDARAHRLARRLQGLGSGPGDRVAVCVERSVEMVVALYGVLQTGAAYVPLDPSYPDDRVAFMIDDAGIGALVTTRSLESRLRFGGPIVRVEDATARAATPSSSPSPTARAATTARETAYVIYTSGSTGNPKGVVIPHGALVSFLTSMRREPGLAPDDVLLSVTTLSFDIAGLELWLPLLTGARVVIASRETASSAIALASALDAYRCSVMQATPATWRMLAEVGWNGRLRRALVGGEGFGPEIAHWLVERADEAWNVYGPTETTIWSACGRLDQREVRIGRAIANTELYVLDEVLRPLPIDVVGELYIAGEGLAHGYHRRPSLTAERFVPDPVGTRTGARMYRTGDLARWRAEGALECLGRIDHQVKLRGFRIELGEIESALETHPSVREAVVIAREHASGTGKWLVAYVVGAAAGAEVPAADELRARLSARLPDYMVPSAFVLLDELPRTPNGKIDRKALPAPEQRASEAARREPPRTPAEVALVDVWTEVLGARDIGVEDNFFMTGGDSLLALRVVAHAKDLGVHVSIQQLFRFPTIRELARHASAGELGPSVVTERLDLVGEADRARLPADVEDAYPLAALQAGMVFHNAFEPGTALYHDVMGFHVRAPLTIASLRDAVATLMERHPVLRTSFHFTGYSEPLQLVHREVEPPVVVEDLRHLAGAEQETWLDRWRAEERRRPFDITRAPLFAVFVHLRTGDTFELTLSFHHAILDGWSVAVLMTDLARLLASGGHGGADVVAARASYRDFVALERRTRQAPESIELWQRQLAGAAATPVARDVAPLVGDAPVHEIDVAVAVATSDALAGLARRARVPIKSVLLASHFAVLRLLTGARDVTTGVVSNGRSSERGGDETLGLFLNTIPYRMAVTGRWIELATRAFELEQHLLPHRTFPAAEIQRRHGRQPLFDTQFNFVHFHVYDSVAAMPGLEVLGGYAFEQTNFALAIDFSIQGGHVHARVRCDATLVTRERAERIARYYERALDAIARLPDATYDARALLSDGEQTTLFVDLSRIEAGAHEAHRSIDKLFEQQVDQTPDAIALAWDDGTLRYRELDARANELAHHLASLGVGRESRVGVLAERSPEMVIALLATLKAGGAYVPLDPDYPRERLAFMVKDARLAAIVLSEHRLRDRLAGVVRAPIVSIDADSAALARRPASRLELPDAPDRAMYVLYTSGSTGAPKGVVVEHAGVHNRIAWQKAEIGPRRGDVVLQKTPFTFDVSGWELWASLTSGAKLVLAAPRRHGDPEYLVRTIERFGVTLTHFVPSMLEPFVSARELDRCRTLSRVVCSGEALSPQLVERFSSVLPAVALHNLYGPTEASIDVSHWLCRPSRAPVPIGHPIRDTGLFVLDPDAQPVPLGVAAELLIGGVGLARGYLARPALTAEKFVPDALSGRTGQRLYRTGDLARWSADGELEYLGRIDHQVKLRGFRIELGEIESVLEAHPSVRRAIALVREDEPGVRRLVAYVVPAEALDPSTDELRAHLRETVPDYMVPAAFVRLDDVPLTPSGKVDRRALPAPEAVETGVEYLEPRTSLERALLDVWRDVLRAPHIGIRDDFFDAGGDSLIAVQVAARVGEITGRDVPLRDVFEAPTVEAMSVRLLDAGSSPAARPPSVVALADPRDAEESAPPMVLIHPMGGDVACYRDLVRELESVRPIYGLRAPGVDEGETPGESVAAIATAHREALGAAGYAAPRCIGGWSFGGLVALELAAQLRDGGAPVALVVLLDSMVADSADPPQAGAPDDEVGVMLELMRDIAQSTGRVPRLERDLVATPAAERLGALADALKNGGCIPAELPLDAIRRRLDVFSAHMRAIASYRPRRYDGPVLLVRATESDPRGSRAWEDLLPRLEIREVNADHYSLLHAPAVRSIARTIVESLNASCASPASRGR